MADDYIKREDAINEICLRGCALERRRKLSMSMCEAKQFAVDVIDDIPAADVRANTYGKWNYNERTATFVCSYCGDAMVRNTYFYCPWCGSYMGGSKDA